ncbi:MAG: hypothetical protein ACT6Q7_10160 [Blastomonas fulva]
MFTSSALKDAKLICDVSLGGTNPKALVDLGAPNRKTLRHVEGLHAKVYLSDRGMVIGSANASGGGIGFERTAGLIEAGTRHAPPSVAYADASDWFNKLWRTAKMVDEDVLSLARRRFRPPSANLRPHRDPKANSVLDAFVNDVERFRGVGFVLTAGSTTTSQRDAAANATIAAAQQGATPTLSRSEEGEILAWNPGNVFSEWSPAEVDAWPRRFICAHRSTNGDIRYFFYERAHTTIVDEDRGMILATRPGTMRRELGFDHGAEALAAVDAPRLRKLYKRGAADSHCLYETPEKLVAALDALGL